MLVNHQWFNAISQWVISHLEGYLDVAHQEEILASMYLCLGIYEMYFHFKTNLKEKHFEG